jgi:adenosine/AMP kinase
MPPGVAIAPGKGIGGLAWARGQVIRSADFASDPRFGPEDLDIVRADNIVSCMVAPIRIGARVEGLIYANNNSTLRPFTVDDEQVLVTLAEHAAVALRNAQVLGAGHVFVLVIRNAYPINILNAVQHVPEVCSIFCATANPVEVIVARSEQGRGIMGVIDGNAPQGVEGPNEVAARREFLRKIGYKR